MSTPISSRMLAFICGTEAFVISLDMPNKEYCWYYATRSVIPTRPIPLNEDQALFVIDIIDKQLELSDFDAEQIAQMEPMTVELIAAERNLLKKVREYLAVEVTK